MKLSDLTKSVIDRLIVPIDKKLTEDELGKLQVKVMQGTIRQIKQFETWDGRVYVGMENDINSFRFNQVVSEVQNSCERISDYLKTQILREHDPDGTYTEYLIDKLHTIETCIIEKKKFEIRH